jgi:glycerol-3-phosphate dehydrogenase (NAD(P)+)
MPERMNRLWNHAGIVGAGSWGTALALVLQRNGLRVTVWGNDPGAIREINLNRENRQYLPGVVLPEELRFTSTLEDLASADLLLLVAPSHALREVAQRLSKVPPAPGAVLLCCTKGVERGSGLRMSQILAETLPGHPVAVLSGPSHAEEVARRAPTAVVLGCEDNAILARLQNSFSNSVFRAYVSNDVTGIELGGALKNIFAIAAGVCDGLGLGDNTKAALVTRSLAEMIRLGVALGGRMETFQGLGGIGDLMVTCFSRHSRNRSFGERLARGETTAQIVATTKMVAEGVPNTYSAWECAKRMGVDAPIIEHVRLILDGKLSPAEALTSLLSRDPRAE